MNNRKVLITGGSGTIGRYLTSLLLEKGYQVSHLSRHYNSFGKVRVFRWDPDKQILDPVILEGTEVIIHLSGANIGDGRWTGKRKEEIIRSRVDSSMLLHRVVTENSVPLKVFITASGIGYYGAFTSEKVFTEEDLPGYDFLADTCRKWEEAACRFENSGIRTVRIRTAAVLERNSGILPKFLNLVSLGIFPKIGKGRHYLPWIHINDLCNIYLKAIDDEKMQGPFNASSPGHVTQGAFVKILTRVMDKKGIYLPVLPVILRTALGIRASLVSTGSRVSPDKIINAGYRFEFDNLHDALKDILCEK